MYIQTNIHICKCLHLLHLYAGNSGLHAVTYIIFYYIFLGLSKFLETTTKNTLFLLLGVTKLALIISLIWHLWSNYSRTVAVTHICTYVTSLYKRYVHICTYFQAKNTKNKRNTKCNCLSSFKYRQASTCTVHPHWHLHWHGDDTDAAALALVMWNV